MNDKVQTWLTGFKAVGSAILVAVCIGWLWLAPSSAPSQEDVTAAWVALVDQIGAAILAGMGAWSFGKAFKDAFFAKQEDKTNESRLEALRLTQQIEATKLDQQKAVLGIEGELDVEP